MPPADPVGEPRNPNVDALEDALNAWWDDPEDIAIDTRAMAKHLAARGVLVPAVISWEDWPSVVAGDEGNRDDGVARLERIARGEP